MTYERLDPKERKKQIFEAALKLAKTKGYNDITRDEIAAEAGVSMGLVSRYHKTMPQLRRSIMRAAIARGIPEIVLQGIACKDKAALNAPVALRRRALASVG